jgi:hypothetical protein
MGGLRRMDDSNEKCIQDFSCNTEQKGPSEAESVDGKIILKSK